MPSSNFAKFDSIMSETDRCSAPCSELIAAVNRYPIDNERLLQLLQAGCCNVNARNEVGMSPLKAVIMNGSVLHAQSLIQAGCLVTLDYCNYAKKAYPHKVDLFAVLEKRCLDGQIQTNTNSAKCVSPGKL
jgi:hypothetical protein